MPLFHLRMEILRAFTRKYYATLEINPWSVWGNDGGRKDFTYLGFVSVIYKA